ncbi:TonB-dependent receptor [Roseateles chitinivorans]|uniref:TonB-dependent receptor n=1 Tax=Roseateles chitinivorans TaxID=2917965 RepID=UPI003D66489F
MVPVLSSRAPRALTQALRRLPVAQACALLMVGASAAHAQSAAPPEAAASAPRSTANPGAKPNEAKKDSDAALETVVVTGIRRSVEDSIAVKRNASSIVEAVSSEDIGKLPDVTVAESLGRVSGVATQRDKVSGKASGVSVRGMSPSFNGSLLNGREQASTSDARSPEFDLFPAELTSSLLVYKTPDPSLIGQGLASTIDLRTIRPLDYGKRSVAISGRKERIGVGSGTEAGDGHRAGLVYVDQFSDRRIGLALGLSSLREDNGGELKFDNWGGYAPQVDYQGQQVTVPGGFLAETSKRKTERDGAFVTLQFKPNADFKTTADLFWSRGNETTKKTGIEGAIAFGTGPYDPNGALTNATIVDGVASAGTLSNYKADVRNHVYGSKDRLLSLGLNSELRTGDWRWEGDIAHSRGVKDISNYETTAGQPGNTPESQLGSISWTGFNGSNFGDVKYTPSLNYADRNVAVLTDVAGWGGGVNSPQAGYVALPRITDQVDSLRFVAHHEAGWGPIAGTRFGANFTRRDKSRTGQEGRLYILGGDGYASVPVPGSETAIAGPTGIPVVSFDPTGTLGSIYGINRWVDSTVLARDWTVREKVATVFAMADLTGDLGPLPYTGNFGFQVVNTRQRSTGNQVDLANCTGITVETCPYVERSDGDNYTRFLPSMNLTLDLGSQQLLRLGAGKQLARPNLDNMKASLDFQVQNATSVSPALTGFAGNPKLKPYEAWALDLSYEKYFGRHGYISTAVFYKKLENYVINAPRGFDFAPYVSANTPLPTTGPFKDSTVGFLTQPMNGQGGNMKGVEVSVNLPLNMLSDWLDGFGTSLNYSYTDSSVRLPTSGFVTPQNGPVFKDSVPEIGLPGLSKRVATVRFYYEKNGWQLAWAAHRRSDFIGQILDYRSDSQFTFIKSETIVDMQLGYEFQSGWMKGLSVLLQGHNMTNAPFQEYTTDPNVITNKVKYGKTYRLGLNYKF